MRRVQPLPDLSIRQLEYLVAVAEEPTWALAAERVGVSPSALSQGLAELERRVGVALFDRDGRRRLVRPAAQPVVAHARQVLGLTERPRPMGGPHTQRTQRAAPARHDRRRRRRALPRALAQVSHRAIPTSISSCGCRRRPSSSSCSLRANSTWWCAWSRRCRAERCPTLDPLLTEDLAVYGPPGHRIGRPATWGPWVLFPSGSHTRAVIVDLLRRLGAPLDVVAESHQPEVLREMVRLGTGWTVLPVSQAEYGDRPSRRPPKLTTRNS